MTSTLRRLILSAVTTCIVVITISACSRAPRIDGGIVGTGHRIDCEAQAKKEPSAVPEDCKRDSRR